MRTLLLAMFLVACVGNPVQPGPSTPVPAEPEAPPPEDRQIDPPEPPAPPIPAEPAMIPADPGPPSVMPDPAPPTAAPLRSAPASLYACTTDADCVIECDLPGNCCGAPCGCRTAVNKHVLAELKQVPWYQCTREDARECPAMGCAYEPAHSASCVSGQCRANDDFGSLSPPGRESPAGPQVCRATVSSTLPGVSISVPAPKCNLSLAAAHAGQTLDYVVTVAPDAKGTLTTDKVDAGGCRRPGSDALIFGEAFRGVDDPNLEYAIRDSGLCSGLPGRGSPAPGTHPRSFDWKAVQWFGPSDFSNPEGPAFPAGRYELVVWASGTYDGAPYRVEARVPVTLN